MILISLLLPLFTFSAEFDWSGEFRSEGHFYGEELPSPTRTMEAILQSHLDLDLKFNSKSRMHLKPLLRSNLSSKEKPENLFLNLQEAFWEIKAEPLKMKLGSNTYHWGILDGYSPMDITNGRVLFNPLSSEKRGAPSLQLSSEFDFFQIQALYIPKQARTLFPSTDSRWLPREVLINTTNADQTVLLPSSFRYYYPGYQDLENALENNFGFKLDSRLGDFDLSFIYFEGTSITPQTRVLATFDVVSISPDILQARTDIGLIPVYFKQRMSGLSSTWTHDDFLLKIESIYSESMSDDPIIPPWSWQNGLAIEIPANFGETSATFLLQTYYGENKDAIDNMISSSSRLFDRSLLFGVRIAFSTETSLTSSILYDYRGQSVYGRIQGDHKWSQNWKSSLTVDILEGDRDTLLGTYDRNDRAVLVLSYLW